MSGILDNQNIAAEAPEIDTQVESTVETTVEPTTEIETGNNPNWDELLSNIPDNLHHLVTPHLTKWDAGVQQKFQKIQSEQEGYAPYKEFMDQGVNPQDIQQAMAVMGMLNDKPEQFFNEMQAFYKDDPRFAKEQSDQGQQEQQYDINDEDQVPDDPRWAQMQQQQEIMANFLANQVQAEEAANEDAALTADLKKLTETYGEYDEDYVLGLAQGGIDLEVAVQRYKAMETKVRTTPTPGSNLPTVVTPSGGVPSSAINPASLTSNDTQSLIANYLASLNQ